MCEFEECELENERPPDYIERAWALGLPVRYLQARADLAEQNGNKIKAQQYRKAAGQLEW